MSAWIVTEEHIGLLTEALFRFEITTSDLGDTNNIGQLLWNENFASVNYLYDETEEPDTFDFERAQSPQGHDRHSLASLYKQTACYHYQSCEHPDWEKSTAYRLTAMLSAMIESCLHLDHESILRSEEGEKAPWGI